MITLPISAAELPFDISKIKRKIIPEINRKKSTKGKRLDKDKENDFELKIVNLSLLWVRFRPDFSDRSMYKGYSLILVFTP